MTTEPHERACGNNGEKLDRAYREANRLVVAAGLVLAGAGVLRHDRSEEHTSELQSLTNLVCRLLLEKKNKTHKKSGRAPSAPPRRASSRSRPPRQARP